MGKRRGIIGSVPPVFQGYVCPVCHEDAVGEWFAVSAAWQQLNRADLQWKRAVCPNGHEMSDQQLVALEIGPGFPP